MHMCHYVMKSHLLLLLGGIVFVVAVILFVVIEVVVVFVVAALIGIIGILVISAVIIIRQDAGLFASLIGNFLFLRRVLGRFEAITRLILESSTIRPPGTHDAAEQHSCKPKRRSTHVGTSSPRDSRPLRQEQ